MSTGTPRAQKPASAVRFRRSTDRLTAGQLRNLRNSFSQMYELNDERGYGYLAGIHGLPTPSFCDLAHGSPYFLPWHRAYLYFFERAMRDRVADASLAWWDWTRTRERETGLPKHYETRRSKNKWSPLGSAQVSKQAIDQGKAAGTTFPRRTLRDPDTPLRLPSANAIKDVLKREQFIDFSRALELHHGAVHNWVGGHMASIEFSAFDPIFWAHHTMCDRIWRLWQLRHPGANPPAAILDEALPPFPMTVRQTLSVTALGYDYAASTASAPMKEIK